MSNVLTKDLNKAFGFDGVDFITKHANVFSPLIRLDAQDAYDTLAFPCNDLDIG